MNIELNESDYLSELDLKYSKRFKPNLDLLQLDITEIEQKLKEILIEKDTCKLEIKAIQDNIDFIKSSDKNKESLGLLSNLYIHLSNLKNIISIIDKNWTDLYNLKFKYRKESNDITLNSLKMSEIMKPRLKNEEVKESIIPIGDIADAVKKELKINSNNRNK